MKDIEWLIEQIEEELEDAENYAWKAMNYKTKDHELSATCAQLSREEIVHAETLCIQATRMVKKHIEGDKADHDHVEHIWDWRHKKLQEKKHYVKTILASI